ncbi:photosynthetic complex assembly protein PuhC [Acidisoma sp. 7E03]
MSATSKIGRTPPGIPHYKLPWSKSFVAPEGAPGHRRIALPPILAAIMMAAAGIVILLPGKPAPSGATVSERSFRIDQQADGLIVMRDATTGAALDILRKDGDGFTRGVLHSIALRRAKLGMSQETPLTLHATADGRLILADPPTETVIDLEAFGSANEAAFAALLPHPVREVAP